MGLTCASSPNPRKTIPTRVIRVKKTSASDSLSDERKLSLSDGNYTGEDVQVRIPFDNTIFLDGQDSQILAFLDSKNRDLVLDATAPGVVILDGAAQWVVNGLVTDYAKLDDMLKLTLKMSQAFSLDSYSLSERLAHNAQHDPDPQFRGRCFEVLMDNSTGRRKRGWSPEVNRVAKLFCSDTNPTLRLKAARFLKTEGLDVLKTLFFTESVPEEVRAEAWVAYAHLKSLPTMDKSDEDHAAEAMIRRLSGRPGKSPDNVTTSPAKQELESMLTQYLSSKGRRSEEVLVAIFETTARLRLRIDYKLLAPALAIHPQGSSIFRWPPICKKAIELRQI